MCRQSERYRGVTHLYIGVMIVGVGESGYPVDEYDRVPEGLELEFLYDLIRPPLPALTEAQPSSDGLRIQLCQIICSVNCCKPMCRS